MAAITVLLADLDGCLVDTAALITASFQHTFQAVFSLTVSAAEIRSTLGEPLKVTFARYTADAAVLEQCIAVYRAHNKEHHDALIQRVPGMLEAVAALAAAGVRLAIVTSKAREMALRGLGACGLAPYFPVCVGLDDCEHHKPHPAPALAALALLGEQPGPHVAFVGDAPTDILCGRAAGCGMTIAVGWTELDRAKVQAAQPTHWVAAASDLAALVLGSRTAAAAAPPPPPAAQPAAEGNPAASSLWARLVAATRAEHQAAAPPSSAASLLQRHELSSALSLLLPHLSELPSAQQRSAAQQRLQAWLQHSLQGEGAATAALVVAEECLLCCSRLMGDAQAGPFCARVCLSWLSAGGMAAVLRAAAAPGQAHSAATAWPAVLQALVSIPDRAARGLLGGSAGSSSAAAAPVPAILTPATYFALLEMEVCKVALLHRGPVLPEAAEAVEAAQGRCLSTVSRLCRLGRARAFGGCWGRAVRLLLPPLSTPAFPLLQAALVLSASAPPPTLPPAATPFTSLTPAQQLEACEGCLLAIGVQALEDSAQAVASAPPRSPADMQAALTAFSCSVSAALDAALGTPAALPPPLHHHLLTTLLLQRALSPHLATALVHWASRACTDYSAAGLPLVHLAGVWSSPAYLARTDAGAQGLAARALAAAVGAAPAALFHPTAPLLGLLMEGVQLRMDADSEAVRRGALRVAEAFSGRVSSGGSVPGLSFEEVRGEERRERGEESAAAAAIAAGRAWQVGCGGGFLCTVWRVISAGKAESEGWGGGQEVEEEGSTGTAEAAAAAAPTPTPPPPAAAAATSQALCTPPAALLLARAKAAAACPGFLADSALFLSKWCTDAGSNGGSAAPLPPDTAMGALSTLASSIRSAGLEESELHALLALTPSLLRTLLALEDKCAWGWKFAAWRQAALVALGVSAAPLVSRMLLQRLVHGDVGEGGRLEILDLLVAMAGELAGRCAAPQAPPPPWRDAAWSPTWVDDTPGALEEVQSAGGYVGAVVPAGEGEEERERDSQLQESDRLRSMHSTLQLASAADAAAAQASPFSHLVGPYFFWPLFSITSASPTHTASSALLAVLHDKGWGLCSPTGAPWDADVLAMAGGGTQEGGAVAGAWDSPTRAISVGASGAERLLSCCIGALAVFLGEAGAGGDVGGGSFLAAAAPALLALAWRHREHASAGVRRACITAFCSVVGAVHRGGDAVLLLPSVLALSAASAAPSGAEEGVAVFAAAAAAAAAEAPPPPPSAMLLLPRTALASKLGGARALQFSPGSGQGSAEELRLQAVELMSTPRLWDDLVELVHWLKGVGAKGVSDESLSGGGGAASLLLVEPDPQVRALAADLLGNGILQELVLGPLEGMGEGGVGV